MWGAGTRVPDYDGTEGELYDCRADPWQWNNLWNEPRHRRWRDELIDDLRRHLPPERTPPLPVEAPT